MNYICITGNPVKGFQFHGPFPSDHAAVDWAEKEMGLDIDWYVSVLRKPSAALSDKDKILAEKFSHYWDNKEIHYKDGNPKNYNIDNLEVVEIKPFDQANSVALIDGEISADNESYAASMLPGINPEDIEHLSDD